MDTRIDGSILSGKIVLLTGAGGKQDGYDKLRDGKTLRNKDIACKG